MACMCPGVVTLIANLISSDTSTAADNTSLEPLWRQNYRNGKGFEVYRTNLSPSLRDMPFTEVAKLVYDETAAVRP